MPLIHVVWYLDKYLLDCGHADAVVGGDDTPAMAATLAMSDLWGRSKVAILAVSRIKQKDVANAVGSALQHAIITRYMLEADQTEQGATAATWDTQEEFCVAFHCGFWTAAEGSKGTRRCMLQKPSKSRS